MKEHFIRHRIGSLGHESIRELFEDDILAIHYPGDGPRDSRSCDAKDYKELGAKRAIRAFCSLAKTGGYVWAQYPGCRQVKIGTVEAGSNVDRLSRRWEATGWTKKRKDREVGDLAILKALKLTRVRTISADRLMMLRAVRPRGSTVCEWHKADGRLAKEVEGEELELRWRNLSPAQQEVATAQFLREHDLPGIPHLDMLLMPPGRTLKTVDIYGRATGDDGRLFVQVTNRTRKAAEGKTAGLRDLRGPKNHLLMVCESDDVVSEDEVTFVPISLVDEWIQQNKARTRAFRH